jgi:hypothetical protein
VSFTCAVSISKLLFTFILSFSQGSNWDPHLSTSTAERASCTCPVFLPAHLCSYWYHRWREIKQPRAVFCAAVQQGQGGALSMVPPMQPQAQNLTFAVRSCQFSTFWQCGYVDACLTCRMYVILDIQENNCSWLGQMTITICLFSLQVGREKQWLKSLNRCFRLDTGEISFSNGVDKSRMGCQGKIWSLFLWKLLKIG